jgi:hypothetical protein
MAEELITNIDERAGRDGPLMRSAADRGGAHVVAEWRGPVPAGLSRLADPR